MDREHFILAAGLTAAVAIGSFILWGPSSISQNRRKGSVIGLQNLGLTCYLNSLLQALASCHYFVQWLNNQKYEGKVADNLRNLLNVLAGNTEGPADESFVSPIELIHALNHGGWKITNSQQDVHELLCTMITILEDEAFKAYSDLNVVLEGLVLPAGIVNGCSSSKCSPADSPVPNGTLNTLKASHTDFNSSLSPNSARMYTQLNGTVKTLKCSDNLNSCKNIVLGTSRLRSRQSPNHNLKPSPFRGYLMNRIECTKCSYKSVVRCDKFDIISLHLPEHGSDPGFYTLNHLLDNFVKHEMINDITCEGCNRGRDPATEPITSPAVKSLRFGKLPGCLCLHIVRTSFHEFGVYKRQDYVDFPEYVIMDPYVFRPNKNRSFTASEILSDYWLPNSSSDGNYSDISLNFEQLVPKYVYKLQSVIVHRGSHNDGHFMTYRRGNSGSDKRWYLVSDVDVKETTLYAVLSSVAYVLFYEKCSTAN